MCQLCDVVEHLDLNKNSIANIILGLEQKDFSFFIHKNIVNCVRLY